MCHPAFTIRRTRRWASFGLVIAVLTLFTGLFAFAGKPPGGGGSGGPGLNGGGLIYFSYDRDIYTMNDDGSGVTLFTGYDTHDYGAYADPSRVRHGGQRWFVQRGWPVDHLLLLSDNGAAVPLPLPDDLEIIGTPRWDVNDAFISFEGVQFDADPDSPTFGEPLQGGLYAVWLVTDSGGNPSGADGPPDLIFERPLVPDSVEIDQLRPDMQDHDWGPDGTQFVFAAVATHELVIGDVLTGMDRLLFDAGDSWVATPKWSPADDAIMFNYRPWGKYPTVALVNSNGGSLKTLARSGPSYSWTTGVWSPTGSHLLVKYRDHYGQDNHFVRMAADGSGKTRITAKSAWPSITLDPRVTGWRQ